MKKALIIAPEYMGYTAKIADNLRKKNIDTTAIHIPPYNYPSFSIRVQNFFLKIISKDIKFKHREIYIKKVIKDDHFDTILVIRPDLISTKMLQDLKERSQYLKTYFFDGIYRFPKKFKTLPYFDEIYSFEPSDCKKFGFIPITNFIYQESNFVKKKHTDYKYKIFNITSYDRKRFHTLLKIAAQLKKQNHEYKIIIKTNKKIKSNVLIDYITKPMSLAEINVFLNNALCMLDLGVIQKHKGLTFRVFEAMGQSKKIITNNPEIVNYDFYNPQNILIIDEKNIKIPPAFFTSDYIQIPADVYNKYTINTWTNIVFSELFI